MVGFVIIMGTRRSDGKAVKLGSSGLKVSKIILGCVGYGTPEWYSWVKNEEDSIRDITAAYVLLPSLPL